MSRGRGVDPDKATAAADVEPNGGIPPAVMVVDKAATARSSWTIARTMLTRPCNVRSAMRWLARSGWDVTGGVGSGTADGCCCTHGADQRPLLVWV